MLAESTDPVIETRDATGSRLAGWLAGWLGCFQMFECGVTRKSWTVCYGASCLKGWVLKATRHVGLDLGLGLGLGDHSCIGWHSSAMEQGRS